MTSGANNTGIYLIRSMPVERLKQPEADGRTIKQWAEENGHIGSPAGQELLRRLR